MVTLVVGYLTVAILFILIVISAIIVLRKIQFRRYHNDFWNRQSNLALNETRFLDLKENLEPYNFMQERAAIDSTLQTISLALDSGIFKLLNKNPGSSEDILAAQLGISKQAWRAVAEVLLASKVIIPHINGYSLSKQAQIYLSKESPFFETLPPPVFAKRLLKKLRRTGMDRKVRYWAKGKSPKRGRFSFEQHRYSFPIGFAIHKSGLLQNATNILDVAGGVGSVCIALALMNDSLKIQLIELPDVIKVAKKMIEKYSQSDRIKCLNMDMFVNNWPDGLDAVLFTNIFHDWNDAKCQILARKAYKALKPGGLILIQEALLHDDKPGPLWTAHWSMTMALEMQGRQFHGKELQTLLEDTGFSNIQINPILGYFSSVAGVKVIQN